MIAGMLLPAGLSLNALAETVALGQEVWGELRDS